MKAAKLVRLSLLTAAALVIFVLEAQVPLPVAVPGFKLGLANIITLYAMFTLGAKPAFAILLCRILLGSMYAGQAVSLIYSFAGGMACYAAIAVVGRHVSKDQIWACGVIGAIFHNIGQICAAAAVLGSWTVAVYLPPLIALGILSGSLTGLAAQHAINRINKK